MTMQTVDTPEQAIVALGANLGLSRPLLVEALRRLARLPGTRVSAVAPLYETDPVDVAPAFAARRFLNTVALLETTLPPEALLAAAQQIERTLGRPSVHAYHAPRTVDIDLICHGMRICTTQNLILPHPQARQRGFVLRPLADLLPDFHFPADPISVADHLRRLPEGGCRRQPDLPTPEELTMANPFLADAPFPLFDQMMPPAAEEALGLLLTLAEQRIDVLEAAPGEDWDDLVGAVHDACRPLTEAWGFVNHLHAVMNTEAWRALIETFQPKLVGFFLRVAQSRPLYRAYESLARQTLPPVRRRIVEALLRDARQAGVGLDGEARETFNALSCESARLATLFTNHVLDATKAFALTLTCPEEMDGLPVSFRGAAARAAGEAGAVGATEAHGPWRVTLDSAVYVPFMKDSRNRAARETLWRAQVTRASADETDNTALIEALLENRRRSAALLGFGSYAEQSLSRKMAGSVGAVDTLLETLLRAARGAAEREDAELLAFARAQGFAGERLMPWDTPFWAERLREARYAYDEESLRAYFPFPRVLDGLFALSSRLFGIRVDAADGQAPVWHPDVRFFRVSDQDGTPLAAFYLDPYSRPENKNGGAWMDSFRTREHRPDGTIALPVAVLVCNQSRPDGDRPSLMRFDEVTTLFHEFGHALQHMLTTVDDPQASGINGIEWDAVEIASQFLENFCYDRPTLDGLASHVDTGAPLPAELFDKILAARRFRAAAALLRQLYFAATDLELHARYPRTGESCANDVKTRMARTFLVQPVLLEDRFLCAFTHIFAGGYSAGYYSYKWSEVLAADAFGAFEEIAAADEAALAVLGRKFRDTVLGLGGGTHPGEVFRAFRGRDPSIDALLRRDGLE